MVSLYKWFAYWLYTDYERHPLVCLMIDWCIFSMNPWTKVPYDRIADHCCCYKGVRNISVPQFGLTLIKYQLNDSIILSTYINISIITWLLPAFWKSAVIQSIYIYISHIFTSAWKNLKGMLDVESMPWLIDAPQKILVSVLYTDKWTLRESIQIERTGIYEKGILNNFLNYISVPVGNYDVISTVKFSRYMEQWTISVCNVYLIL